MPWQVPVRDRARAFALVASQLKRKSRLFNYCCHHCYRIIATVSTAIMFRRRAVNNERSNAPPPKTVHLNGSIDRQKGGPRAAISVAGALLDSSLVLLLVFGGCCSCVLPFPHFLTFRFCTLNIAVTVQQCLGLRRTAPRRAWGRCV